MNVRNIREKVFRMVDVGFVEDAVSRAYDIVNLLIIIINLVVSIALTFDNVRAAYGGMLTAIEAFTIAFFALDYALRIWTADFLFPDRTYPLAIAGYIFSVAGIIDLVSFMPYYLPAFYPAGTAAFRLFRVVRIFKLFRIGAYSDSLSIISTVIYNKRQQLFSAVFIIFVLMIASSLCMYHAEHDAQPEVFKNALSGIWWAGSTLLTVGYGDIYPVTPIGQVLGIFIAFLGVGVVAIPTGIISAGFIEQYNEIKKESAEAKIHFIRVRLLEHDAWIGNKTADIALPHNIKLWSVQRNGEEIPIMDDLVLEDGDILILRTETVG